MEKEQYYINGFLVLVAIVTGVIAFNAGASSVKDSGEYVPSACFEHVNNDLQDIHSNIEGLEGYEGGSSFDELADGIQYVQSVADGGTIAAIDGVDGLCS